MDYKATSDPHIIIKPNNIINTSINQSAAQCVSIFLAQETAEQRSGKNY